MADGTITYTVTDIPDDNRNPPMKVLTFNCVASADLATFPATTIDADTIARLKGYNLVEGRTNPGATAPQAAYDITLTDSDGIDLMGGRMADRSATASEAAVPEIASGVPWPRPVDGALTLTITNNNVNSAIVVAKFFFER